MRGCNMVTVEQNALGVHRDGAVLQRLTVKQIAALPHLSFAATPPATPQLADAANSAVTTVDRPVSGNVLDNATIPSGKAANVTSFMVAGSSTVRTPRTPAALSDPTSGVPVGTLLLLSNGSYTFTPAPGYSGPVPTIFHNVLASDGQAVTSSLTIIVLPGASWPFNVVGVHHHGWMRVVAFFLPSSKIIVK